MRELWTRTQKLLTVCTLAVIIVVGWRGCNERSVPSQKVGLSSNVQRLALRSLHLPTTPVPAKRDEAKPYVPPEASVTITPKDPTKSITDVVDISVKYAGFCFKPGIQATFPLGVGLDAKLAFYREYGTGVSLLYSKASGQIDGTLFISRHFRSFDNLEAVVGYRSDKKPYVGLRLSL